jgi:TatD DNase family protein
MNDRPHFIDIHSHVNFAAYDADRKEIIDAALAANVWMINVGTAEETSVSAIDVAEHYEQGIFAAVGLHPGHANPSHHDPAEFKDGLNLPHEQFNEQVFSDMAKNKKVVAIGECGLDFFRETDSDAKRNQIKAFEQQIELAAKTDLPLMIHCRAAYVEALDMLASYKKEFTGLRGDIHFFAGSWQEARQFLDLGFTLSFTGVITFARDYDEVIRNAPLASIMSETDCPYVTPVPYRGKKNQPLYVREVVKKIAEIRGEEFELVRAAMVDNAFRMFKLH